MVPISSVFKGVSVLTISVYIPTRNRVGLLSAAVSSVLAQGFSDLELIVVDDASNDGTVSFLEFIARADARVRVLRNDSPRGAPAARNRAITQAAGEFVTGLDDDDQFEPQRLGALYKSWASFARYKVPLSCIFTQDIFVSHGKDIGVSKKRGTVEFSDLTETNHIGNQIFAPKSVFEGAGLFDEKLPAWQDLELFMRVVKRFGAARSGYAALSLRRHAQPGPNFVQAGEGPSRLQAGFRHALFGRPQRPTAAYAADIFSILRHQTYFERYIRFCRPGFLASGTGRRLEEDV